MTEAINLSAPEKSSGGMDMSTLSDIINVSPNIATPQAYTNLVVNPTPIKWPQTPPSIALPFQTPGRDLAKSSVLQDETATLAINNARQLLESARKKMTRLSTQDNDHAIPSIPESSMPQVSEGGGLAQGNHNPEQFSASFSRVSEPETSTKAHDVTHVVSQEKGLDYVVVAGPQHTAKSVEQELHETLQENRVLRMSLQEKANAEKIRADAVSHLQQQNQTLVHQLENVYAQISTDPGVDGLSNHGEQRLTSVSSRGGSTTPNPNSDAQYLKEQNTQLRMENMTLKDTNCQLVEEKKILEERNAKLNALLEHYKKALDEHSDALESTRRDREERVAECEALRQERDGLIQSYGDLVPQMENTLTHTMNIVKKNVIQATAAIPGNVPSQEHIDQARQLLLNGSKKTRREANESAAKERVAMVWGLPTTSMASTSSVGRSHVSQGGAKEAPRRRQLPVNIHGERVNWASTLRSGSGNKLNKLYFEKHMLD